MKQFLNKIPAVGLILILIHGSPTAASPETYSVMTSSVPEDMADGPDLRLLTRAASRLGLGIRIRRAPFKRRLIMMKNGDIDMVCGLLRRPERESYIHYVLPPYKTRSDTIFFVRRDRAGQIKSYEDLKGLKIGMVRGARYFDRFDKDIGLIKEVAQPRNNFRKLLLGRLDAVIQDEAAGIFRTHLMGVAPKIALSPFRFSREKKVYFGISRKSRMMESLDRIQPVLETLIRSGEARAILSDYYTGHALPVPNM